MKLDLVILSILLAALCRANPVDIAVDANEQLSPAVEKEEGETGLRSESSSSVSSANVGSKSGQTLDDVIRVG